MKQVSHSSSSSSSSPSSPTVDEISVREREDAPDSDISPVPVSEWLMIELGNPCDDSEIPEWLQELRENLVDAEIPEHGNSHVSSSHEASLEPIFKRREWVSTVFMFISLKTEIARSVSGPKLQEPRA